MELYRRVFETKNRWTLVVDGTARAAIECAMVLAVEPGERVLVLSFGRFGQLITEIARRGGADVHVLDAGVGERVQARAGRGRAAAPLAEGGRGLPGRHVDHDVPAAGRYRGALPAPRRADLLRRHRVARRHARGRWTPGASTSSPAGCRSASAGRRAARRSRSPTGRPSGYRRRHIEEGSARGTTRRATARIAGRTTSISRCSWTTGATSRSTTTPRRRRCCTPPASARGSSSRKVSSGRSPPCTRGAGARRRRRGDGTQRVRRPGAQDAQRHRRLDPAGGGREPGARGAAERLRHRDRHLVRTAAREDLADRHDGLTTPARTPYWPRSRRSNCARRRGVQAARAARQSMQREPSTAAPARNDNAEDRLHRERLLPHAAAGRADGQHARHDHARSSSSPCACGRRRRRGVGYTYTVRRRRRRDRMP